MIMNSKHYWDQVARNYDDRHLNKWTVHWYIDKQRVESLQSIINDNENNVLDVACGTGYYLRLFLNNNKNIIGMDLSEEMIRVCRQKGLFMTMVANYEKLPFKDHSFDIVLCINAFQYADNPCKALAEFSRVINKSGKVIVTFSNLWSLRGFIYLFRKILKVQSHPLDRHSIISFKRYVKTNGMEIQDIRGVDYLPMRTGGSGQKNKLISMHILFDRIEEKIRKSILKYFGNEIMLCLVKK
ncbi:MAG: Ubiquinone/menaquinone biosynthesis C-methyltransferase UbiE [Candidatus Methanogaster sp.]|nr:MAG: Ubiquinone/menaquinone biosynthesis C-methyltransferase UbiE [ANME-2 cluster archaeon]